MKWFALSFCVLLILCWVTPYVSAKGGGESGNALEGGSVGETGNAAGVDEANDTGGAAGLSVEAAVQAAVKNSVELGLKNLKLRHAAAAAAEVKAKRGPSVILQTTGSLMSNPVEGFTISEGAFGILPAPPPLDPIPLPDSDVVLMEDAENTYFRITATLTQPLFTWGKLKGAAAAADLNLDIAGEEYLAQEREVERRVRLAYFGALFAEQTTDILTRAESIADEIVVDRESAFSEGLITRQTVLDAVSRKAALTAQLTRAREAGATARLTLSTLTRLEVAETELVSNFRQTPIVAKESEFLTAALSSSSERAVLLHRIDQAVTLLSIEKGSRPFLPDLSLNLSVDVTGQEIPLAGEDWMDSWDTNVIITLGSQTTLFDSGASSSRVKQAEIALVIAKEGLRGLELGLEIQVRSLIETVMIDWSDVHRVAAELDLVKEIERNASVSFDNELITRAEALSAKLAALAAELEYELALFRYETALTELEILVSMSLAARNSN